MQSIECVCACRHTFARAGDDEHAVSRLLYFPYERDDPCHRLLIPVPRESRTGAGVPADSEELCRFTSGDFREL